MWCICMYVCVNVYTYTDVLMLTYIHIYIHHTYLFIYVKMSHTPFVSRSTCEHRGRKISERCPGKGLHTHCWQCTACFSNSQ